MSNISTNKQIAHDWIDAFNSRNLENLLALYDDAAVHFSPKLNALEPDTKGWVAGKTAMREWWSGAFARLQTLQYDLQHLIVDGIYQKSPWRSRYDGGRGIRNRGWKNCSVEGISWIIVCHPKKVCFKLSCCATGWQEYRPCIRVYDRTQDLCPSSFWAKGAPKHEDKKRTSKISLTLPHKI